MKIILKEIDRLNLLIWFFDYASQKSILLDFVNLKVRFETLNLLIKDPSEKFHGKVRIVRDLQCESLILGRCAQKLQQVLMNLL